jgi:hypothetical protein
MHKLTIRPGAISGIGDLFVTIEWKDGRLSISGVSGPKANGDACGSCGQNTGDLLEVSSFATGWSAGMCAKLAEVWERWHLNDMQAGSPAQRKWLCDNPVTATYPESHYEKACAALAEAGLNPDPGYEHNDKPYQYGHAWLREEVPDKVIKWLFDLPPADRPHPWGRNN